ATQSQFLSPGFLPATTVSLLSAPCLTVPFGARTPSAGMFLVFIAASLIGGWAQTMSMVIVARILQGAMTGIIRPVAMDTLFSVYPPDKRGMVTAIYGMCLGLPLTLASVIGGYFVENFGWRYVFFLVIPVCV